MITVSLPFLIVATLGGVALLGILLTVLAHHCYTQGLWDGRDAAAPTLQTEKPLKPEQVSAGFDQVREAIPVDDHELTRARRIRCVGAYSRRIVR